MATIPFDSKRGELQRAIDEKNRLERYQSASFAHPATEYIDSLNSLVNRGLPPGQEIALHSILYLLNRARDEDIGAP